MQQSDHADRTALKPREEVVLCARSMIKRFRETKPSSRREREQVREQRRSKDLWWVRDESPTENDRSDRNYYYSSASITAPSYLAVDKVMSQDIQGFITIQGERANSSSREPPRVIPSPSVPAVSHMPACTSTESYPRRHLLVDIDLETRTARDSEATDGENHDHELYLRDCLELDPKVYTGSAELRGGISPTSPKGMIHGGTGPREQDMVSVRHEGATEETIASAADVASDLDGVLRQLRNGIVSEQRERSPWKLTPRTGSPVNLCQIAHDLDAKLFEFTLMAKARQQVVEEAHQADEAEKDAWRQCETKRVEDMVRQEHAVLHNAATTGEHPASPGIKRVSEYVNYELTGFPGKADPTSDTNDSDNQGPQIVPIKHPALPPSALGAVALHTLAHTNATVEAVTDETAGILRAAEAKLERIEYALRADGSRGEKEGSSTPPKSISTNPAESAVGTIDSPSFGFKEDRQVCDNATERTEEVRIHLRTDPLVSGQTLVLGGIQDETAAELDGLLITDEHMELEPKPSFGLQIPHGHVLERRFVPHQARDLPNVGPEWCLNGHSSLRQAGQCIETELEVAMLYMQRRLDKTPIAYSTINAVGDDGQTKGPHDSVLINVTGKKLQKPSGVMEIEGPSKVSFEQSLEVPADGVPLRRDPHIEIDDGLGLDSRDDQMLCENGSGANELQSRRRVQHDAALFRSNLERGMSRKNNLHGELLLQEGMQHKERIVDSFAFDTPVIVRPVHPSSDGAPFWPAPPAFVQQPDPQPKAPPSHSLGVADDAFPDNTGLIPGLSSMDESARQQSLLRNLQQKNVGGRGSAVARARRRLYSFRAMRQRVSTGFDAATDQHEDSDPWRAFSLAHQKVVAKGQDTPDTMLRRLKVVRSSLK